MTKEERHELAKQIGAVLTNPDTPESVYNALADQMMFYSQFLDYNSAEIIEMSLEAYEVKGNDLQPDITSGEGLSVIC